MAQAQVNDVRDDQGQPFVPDSGILYHWTGFPSPSMSEVGAQNLGGYSYGRSIPNGCVFGSSNNYMLHSGMAHQQIVWPPMPPWCGRGPPLGYSGGQWPSSIAQTVESSNYHRTGAASGNAQTVSPARTATVVYDNPSVTYPSLKQKIHTGGNFQRATHPLGHLKSQGQEHLILAKGHPRNDRYYNPASFEAGNEILSPLHGSYVQMIPGKLQSEDLFNFNTTPTSHDVSRNARSNRDIAHQPLGLSSEASGIGVPRHDLHDSAVSIDHDTSNYDQKSARTSLPQSQKKSPKESNRGKKRKLSPAGRIHAKDVRQSPGGACPECRRKKTKASVTS